MVKQEIHFSKETLKLEMGSENLQEKLIFIYLNRPINETGLKKMPFILHKLRSLKDLSLDLSR